MTKFNDLIKKFQAIKEELNKNMNMSYSTQPNSPNATTGTSGGETGMYRSEEVKKELDGMDQMAMSECLKFDNNGQWSLDKVDPEENINIPHPKGKAKMADGVNKKEMSAKLGTNQRLANPPEKACHDGRGNVHMVKDEGTNEEAASSKPHNKGKFKVMDEAKEKESKKEKVAGLPYNGEDKKVHKTEKVLVGTGTNDENKSPGRNGGFGL